MQGRQALCRISEIVIEGSNRRWKRFTKEGLRGDGGSCCVSQLEELRQRSLKRRAWGSSDFSCYGTISGFTRDKLSNFPITLARGYLILSTVVATIQLKLQLEPRLPRPPTTATSQTVAREEN